MSQAVLRIEELPDGALGAAAAFHREWSDQALALLEGGCDSLAILMPPAPYDHADWRRATARDFARAWAPARVNVVAGDDEAAVQSALAFLAGARGITGQYLPLSGESG
jgi:hypothetical protein